MTEHTAHTEHAGAGLTHRQILTILGGPNLIRGGSHSGNVAAEDLARAGLLDIVSSDYIPSSLLLSAWRLAEIWGDLPRAVALARRVGAVTLVAAVGARLLARR